MENDNDDEPEPGDGQELDKDYFKLAAKVKRDSEYRIAALQAAVRRAGQDGGIEGTIDVLVLAEVYYGWCLGKESAEKPAIEKMLKGEND
jgi:hypothetical protein